MAQAVSAQWLNEFNNTILDKSYVKLSISVSNPEADADVTVADDGHEYYANTPQVVDEIEDVYEKFSTLEPNIWVLDGSSKHLPNSGYNSGYVADDFTLPKTVTLNYTQVFTKLIKGITITWSEAYNEYATAFDINVYNGTTLVANESITGNTDIVSVVEFDINNYDKIEIVINEWCLPDRRARIEDILVGIRKSYKDSELISHVHESDADLALGKLPTNKIKYVIDNIDGSYDPENDTGFSKYLIEQQKVVAKYGLTVDGNVEYISGGVFYLSEWKAKTGGIKAEFEAKSLLGLLDDIYYKGTYGYKSYYTLIDELLEFANLPLNPDGTKKWTIDNDLSNYGTDAPLPMKSVRECLQMLANASCSVIELDRLGNINVKRLGSEPTYEISRYNMFEEPVIELEKPVRRFVINKYTYNVANSNSELYKGVVTSAQILIKYKKPATNVSASVSSGSITSAEYFSNACLLTLSANCTLTVTGRELEVSKAELSVDMAEEGVEKKLDNVMLTDDNVIGVALTHYPNILARRKEFKAKYRPSIHSDVYDRFSTVDKYGRSKIVRINSLKYEYKGAFKGTVKGVIE